jgi:hypothetical protein
VQAGNCQSAERPAVSLREGPGKGTASARVTHGDKMAYREVPLRNATADMLGLIAAPRIKLGHPVAGKPLILPSLGELLVKLILLYLSLVIIAAALTFVFKSDPPSWTSTIAFSIITLALAVLIFSR